MTSESNNISAEQTEPAGPAEPDHKDADKDDTGSWLLTPQPRLGSAGLITLLIIVNVLVPFSLDIYTPTVPELPAYFNTSETLVNLTVLGFFLFFATGLLLFGPISDKLGRKPVLVGGFAAYIAGSILCAVAPNIYWLIIARVIQATGGGAACAVCTALIKDCFVQHRRGTMLAILQVLMVLGPVIAPLLGGMIIQFAPWQTIFWVLVILGAACLIGAVLYRETLPESDRLDTGVIRSLAGLGRIAKIKGFMPILIVASTFSIPFMAYIEVGSYIYVDFFSETQQVYTYFFAVTAAIATLGPMLHLRFGKHWSPWAFTYVLIAIGLVAGIGLLAVGDRSVWIFAALLVVFALAESTVRPYTTDILLGMASRDVGSASSLINFLNTGLGVVGMVLIMLPFPDYIIGLGAILVLSMAVSLPIWIHACRVKPENAEE